MACCWKPLRSEKERLKAGAAMLAWGGLAAYIWDCDEGEPAGNEDSDERATCILRPKGRGRRFRRACALRGARRVETGIRRVHSV